VHYFIPGGRYFITNGGSGHNIMSDSERCYNERMATQRKIKVTNLEEIREIIRQHKPELKRQFHVDRIGVFGSYARGNQKKRSDIDFLVTFDEPVSYFDLGGLKLFVEELTGLESHVVPSHNLRPEFRDNILKQVKYID